MSTDRDWGVFNERVARYREWLRTSKCCCAGAIAWPSPCPWHPRPTPDPGGAASMPVLDEREDYAA